MGIKITGLDKLEKQLNQMQKKAEQLNGTHNVKMKDLFTNNFMRKNTRFMSFQSFVDAAPFEMSTQEQFDALPQKDLDNYIRANTKYKNFNEMSSAAANDWAASQLGFY